MGKIFDYSILKRPIIGYVPDLAKYISEVGMYTDYLTTMPFPICYTEEEVAKVNQIEKTPSIPINHIDLEGKDENKLNPTEAQNIHNLIKKYEDANGDNKFKVMTKENYETIKNILTKESLTKEDIETLKNIWKNPK